MTKKRFVRTVLLINYCVEILWGLSEVEMPQNITADNKALTLGRGDFGIEAKPSNAISLCNR